MCQNKDCTCNFNGRIFLDESDNPNGVDAVSKINIIGKSPIKVRSFMIGDVKTYEISLYIPTAPTVNIDVAPSVVEFGKLFTSTFTVSYTEGSSPIKTKVLTPLPSGVNINTSPFSFNITDTPTQAGTRYVHTFTVTNEDDLTATVSKGIDVQYRYYRGKLNRNAALTVADVGTFESGLGGNIQAVFGSKRHYVNNGTDAHFVWLKPVGSSEMGTPVGDGNFPFETRKEGYTIQLNGIPYEIIKTVNFYPNSTDVELSF